MKGGVTEMAKTTSTFKIELDRSKTKEQREYEGTREWSDYWRQNPPQICF